MYPFFLLKGFFPGSCVHPEDTPPNLLNTTFDYISRFEDIEVWQEARKMVQMVYEVINRSDKFRKDLRLVSQIQGATVSTMANIAEGFSRKSNKEFSQFLFISKSSAAEVQSHLYVALDQDYITQEDFEKIYAQADKISKMVSGFIKYLNTQTKKSQMA